MKEALDKKLNSVILKASFYYIPCVKMPYGRVAIMECSPFSVMIITLFLCQKLLAQPLSYRLVIQFQAKVSQHNASEEDT